MSVDYIADAGRKAKGQRPYFLESAQTEQLLNITMAIAQELAVTRERMDTIERLLEAGNGVTREAIENYKPDAAAAEQRQTWHQEFISRILRIVQQSREEITENTNGQADMETVVSQVSQ
ncbi:hypothetical protein [Alteromonas lipolytica]|uniref:Uncharacterized protein n=1 Tax=Alteromonas lipolytica TaxID=1856405 RepID=A0A1E8FCI1_9ALTE|nr:hypothetical protein [Alteromonas lipolytica]OFI33318.1 hypothetical protein BFC17_03390 [Alteromonas lipolytica]GGF60725.1 hypothetical protein GCM10011338_11240 [Alteromonas lipolytica]